MRVTTICAALALAAAHAPGAAAQTSSTGPYYAAPSWDQQLAASSRFIVLTNWQSLAFLDREDGLVWEVDPHPAAAFGDALRGCENSTTGGRIGWRLPTLAEFSRTYLSVESMPSQFGPGYPPLTFTPGLPLQIGENADFWTVTLNYETNADGTVNTSTADRKVVGYVNTSLPQAVIQATVPLQTGVSFICVQSASSSPLE